MGEFLQPLSGGSWRIIAGVGVCVSLGVGVGWAQSGDAHEVAEQRQEQTLLAQQLILEGDAAYQRAEYTDSTQKYRQALEMMPKAPATSQLREQLVQRYAQSATAYAGQMVKVGRYDEAREALRYALKDSVAPDHVGAQTMLQKLDDPIAVQPALTPEHVALIEKVRKLLYEAEGAYQLASYDEAEKLYQKVLQVDPYNRAARRGMERVSRRKTQYAESAYDQARAKLLSDVAGDWELPKQFSAVDPTGSGRPQATNPDDYFVSPVENKVDSIVIPTIDFQDINLEEAADMLRIFSREYDQTAISDQQRGLNFVLNIGNNLSDVRPKILAQPINLQLSNVPLRQLLDYITQATNTTWYIDNYAVVITAGEGIGARMVTRRFSVPPNFMDSSAVDSQEESGGGSIFDAPESSSSGIEVVKLSAKEFLSSLGVAFPEGANASYAKGSNLLTVTNTEANIRQIEGYIESLKLQEQVVVMVNLKVYDILAEDFEELGFDWVVGPQGLTGNGNFLGGQTNIPDDLAEASPRALIFTAEGSAGLDDRIVGLLTALDQKKSTDMIASPSVVTRSGERAKVEYIEEFIYPTEYDPPQLPQQADVAANGAFPVVPATPVAFETRNLGYTFEIEPVISEDKTTIDLRLNPEIVKFQGFINYGSPIQAAAPLAQLDDAGDVVGFENPIITENAILMPIFDVIRINDGVTVYDGQTVIVGTMYQTRVENETESTPILGDIPFIGRFFRTEGFRTERRAVLISVQAQILDPMGKPLRENR